MLPLLLGGAAAVIGLVIAIFSPTNNKAAGFLIFAVGIGAVGRWYQMKNTKKKKK